MTTLAQDQMIDKARSALEQACARLDEAKAGGVLIQFSITENAAGKPTLTFKAFVETGPKS